MEFIDEVKVLGSRSRDLAEKLTTEEATKTALILPFIRLLGYDIFNPAEVVPEFQAEAGVKKDQRVDYALLKDDHPDRSESLLRASLRSTCRSAQALFPIRQDRQDRYSDKWTSI